MQHAMCQEPCRSFDSRASRTWLWHRKTAPAIEGRNQECRLEELRWIKAKCCWLQASSSWFLALRFSLHLGSGADSIARFAAEGYSRALTRAAEGPSPEAMDAAEAIRLRSESSSVRIALIPRPGGAPRMADLLALYAR
jgi:hypothetical protein